MKELDVNNNADFSEILANFDRDMLTSIGYGPDQVSEADIKNAKETLVDETDVSVMELINRYNVSVSSLVEKTEISFPRLVKIVKECSYYTEGDNEGYNECYNEDEFSKFIDSVVKLSDILAASELTINDFVDIAETLSYHDEIYQDIEDLLKAVELLSLSGNHLKKWLKSDYTSIVVMFDECSPEEIKEFLENIEADKNMSLADKAIKYICGLGQCISVIKGAEYEATLKRYIDKPPYNINLEQFKSYLSEYDNGADDLCIDFQDMLETYKPLFESGMTFGAFLEVSKMKHSIGDVENEEDIFECVRYFLREFTEFADDEEERANQVKCRDVLLHLMDKNIPFEVIFKLPVERRAILFTSAEIHLLKSKLQLQQSPEEMVRIEADIARLTGKLTILQQNLGLTAEDLMARIARSFAEQGGIILQYAASISNISRLTNAEPIRDNIASFLGITPIISMFSSMDLASREAVKKEIIESRQKNQPKPAAAIEDANISSSRAVGNTRV